MKVIDYDTIEEWEHWIDEVMFKVIPSDFATHNGCPEYIEDAVELLYQHSDRHQLEGHLLEGLDGYLIRLYHGTRLTPSELEAIRNNGLRPLNLSQRKDALSRVFKNHPEWDSVKTNLDQVLRDLGPGEQAGKREDGKIHCCFSRMGLLEGCSHYLSHGAEVDGHVAHLLFKDAATALELIRSSRTPYLISLLVSFDSALEAANPFGHSSESMPPPLSLLVHAWAYRKFKTDFSPRVLRDCTAAMFAGSKPAHELENFELVPEDAIKNVRTKDDT
ncbi:MAG: hypothetical protein AAGH67_10005 [Cyanobacteria bacterium P01_H01_bin.162]